MPGLPPAGHAITRRRFLGAVSLLAIGGVAVEAMELLRQGQPAPQAEAGATPLRVAATSGPRQTFRSRTDLAPPLMEASTPSGSVASGFLFLTPSNGAGQDGPTILDDTGELVWMHPGTGKTTTDLRVATYQGKPVLTWWEGSNNAGIGSGEHVVVDSSYREVVRIRGGSGRQVDLHELQLTPSGTALFFADAGIAAGVPAGASPVPWQILDCAVQEVDIATGALRFEWHAADHIALDESVVDAPTTKNSVYDYVHTNSIEVDTDGNLIVSARNTSAIYKIDRSSGAIIWRLGGKRSDFAMGPGTTFGLQHDARRQPDGTLTIFDDGAGPGASRAIVLRLDETAMTATLVREYAQPHGLFSASQGNMQVLPNGNVFVGWGSQPHFSEYSADGTLVLDATFTATQSYRDYRFPWVGRPTEPPAIAVDEGGSRPTVYASWNGATEVATWDVLAGASATSLSYVVSAPRSGFETAIALKAPAAFVAVRARDASGTVLGTSQVTATTS